ncbi:DUF421 domain-containing protein [Paenibacillus pasadenensis]|uniref:YetF C-terminal domain-containing protein n=1 Tax=Paenibacillus pasadenensis TaxID=217090 RepID=A0A2N5NCW5_9BACL|nr:YetF domain-containing protein [Paenibacillus pasadenensis]PLT48163.1 hypothetical protein B8V81_0295 [Paenibacillus pasadenensis]
MSFDWVWKSAFLVLVGIVLLRAAGRKPLSQMSIAPAVIMISIGTTIVQPIANHHLWIAIGSAVMFILTLLAVDWLELKSNRFERLVRGGSKIIIENGQIHEANLRKLRHSVDQIEMQLRNLGISSLSEIERATLEPNGLLGYQLTRRARPATVGDLEDLLLKHLPAAAGPAELFDEVSRQGHGTRAVDSKLQ